MICIIHQIIFGLSIEKNEMGRACNTYGGEEKCIQGFVGKPEDNRPLRIPRGRLVNNIKIKLQEVGWVGMGWIDLAQDSERWWALVT
jgi:hypothetical protein